MKHLLAVLACLSSLLLLPPATGQGGSAVTIDYPAQVTYENLASQARRANENATVPIAFSVDSRDLRPGTLWVVNFIYTTTGNRKDGIGRGVAQPFLLTFRAESGKEWRATANFPDSGTVLVQVLVAQAGNPAVMNRWFSRSVGLGGGRGVEVLVSDKPGNDNDIIILKR